ncbi:MAG: hypothetical protein JXK07_10795, partial [Spirochaetes bacterium]|nr:hypothetical protein [Spirochaetota bacterium]
TKEPPCTERYARWCERTVGKIITYLLLDCLSGRFCLVHTALFYKLSVLLFLRVYSSPMRLF